MLTNKIHNQEYDNPTFQVIGPISIRNELMVLKYLGLLSETYLNQYPNSIEVVHLLNI